MTGFITTPHAAELNAERVMREWGFTDALATTGGSDGGIDVRSKHALAQVKWKGGVTGRPDIQNLYGARGSGTQQLFFFSASGYSPQAIEYAEQVGVCLFTYDPTGAVEAVNKVVVTTPHGPVWVSPISWNTAIVIIGVIVAITITTALAIVAASFLKSNY